MIYEVANNELYLAIRSYVYKSIIDIKDMKLLDKVHYFFERVLKRLDEYRFKDFLRHYLYFKNPGITNYLSESFMDDDEKEMFQYFKYSIGLQKLNRRDRINEFWRFQRLFGIFTYYISTFETEFKRKLKKNEIIFDLWIRERKEDERLVTIFNALVRHDFTKDVVVKIL